MSFTGVFLRALAKAQTSPHIIVLAVDGITPSPLADQFMCGALINPPGKHPYTEFPVPHMLPHTSPAECYFGSISARAP